MKQYTIEKIKKQLLENDGKEYNIIYLKDTYVLLHRKKHFYYIQNDTYYTINGSLYMIIYDKIDYNHKKQASYAIEVNNFNDILNIMLETDTNNKHFKKELEDAPIQTIFHQTNEEMED